MEKIKLVIWDLDETFWKGTLSEEGIEAIAENIHVVKELTNRGIINSIVSKNDFESAKNKLTEIGIWDYFVFPAIEWKPKGQLVKQIIENCQLRDTNVLFLDDLSQNLGEAKFYNPNLNVKTPDFISEILSNASFQGKDDSSHSRLKQYKLLEEKAVAKTKFSSNQEFLSQSQIRLQKIVNLDAHIDRIAELVNRTNQLNYTKIRLAEEEIKSLLTKENVENVAIQVKDKYGDYGIVGFYSLDLLSNSLTHFVFSCRILNLGIPQFVYASLKFPKIEVIPEVAENLDLSNPNWIEETTFAYETPQNLSGFDKPKVLFIGGCDYSQLFYYLENNNIEVQTHVNFNNDLNFIVRPSHTDILLGEKNYPEKLKQSILENKLVPFFDLASFNSGLFEGNYDCFIFNPRMDYELFVYENNAEKFLAPYGGIGIDWTDPRHTNKICETYQKRNVPMVNKSFLKSFSEDFSNLGRISPERFIKNLNEIRKSIPKNKPIVMINCPELNLSFNPLGQVFAERFKEMNDAIDLFVKMHENVHLMDIRKIVDDESKVTTDLGHFQRKYYREISLELLRLLDQILDKQVSTKLSIKSKAGGLLRDFIFQAKVIKRKILNQKQ